MILAYKGTSLWPSKMIRWFSWSDYSHIAWLTEQGEVIEAWPPKVRICKSFDEGHTPGTHVDIYEVVGLTSGDRETIETFLRNQVGKKYDWRGVFHFVTRNGNNSRTKWFCSELVFKALLKADIKLLKGIPPYKVTPGMLVLSPLLKYVGTKIVRKHE